MKSWFQAVFSAFLFCVWAQPPQAIASSAIVRVPNTVKQAAEEFGVAISTNAKHSIVVDLLDKNGAVITQLAAKLTPRTELAKYKPSEVMKMIDIPDAKKYAGFSFLNMAKQKLLRLPAESFGFFVSLGAIVTYDLIQNASYNPVGFEHLVQSQLDPLGQVAFYAFMVSQGAASEPFMHMIKDGRLNPRMAPFIKYSGMSIGMMASNIVHEIGAFGACAKRWIPQSKAKQPGQLDNCDKAFATWNDRGGLAGVTAEWRPGLLSLIASTLISGVIETGYQKVKFLVSPLTKQISGVVVTAGKWSLGKIVQVAGIELALLIVPGGAFIKGFRVVSGSLAWLGQMTLFNAVQHAIELKIADAYGTAVKSADLQKLDSKIVSNILSAKKNNWSPEASQVLGADVKSLNLQMKKWRQHSMMEVLQSQSNWDQKLIQFTTMYRNSHLFYSDFISRMWDRKFGPFKDHYAKGNSVSILDRNFPLNGVLVAKAATEDETTWLEAPDMIEQRQLYTITSNLSKYQVPASLTQVEQKIVGSMVQDLKQPDRIKVGQALDRLNCYVNLSLSNPCKPTGVSTNLNQSLKALRSSLGNPKPIWNSGLGYLLAYSTTPANQKEMAQVFYAKSWGPFTTKTFPESMIASMMFGPDLEKGETSLVSNFGFKDKFKAPRIRILDSFIPMTDNLPINTPTFDIFNTGIYNYLNKGNIRNSVLNSNKENFDLWWKKYPETQYLMGWLDYERIYQENIAKLIKSLNLNDEKFLNYGSVSTGILTAHEQEIKFYTMLLGEIQKDSLAIKNVPFPDEFFSSHLNPVIPLTDGARQDVFAYLMNNWNLNFMAYQQTSQKNVVSDSKLLRNLVWQDEIIQKFDDIKNQIGKLQTRTIRVSADATKTMPVSYLDPKELKMKTEILVSYLKDLQAGGFSKELMLNPEQAALVNFCFQSLKNNLTEIESLADVANAASYVPRHDDQGFVKRQCVEAPKASGLGGVKAVQRAVEGC